VESKRITKDLIDNLLNLLNLLRKVGISKGGIIKGFAFKI